MVEVALEKRTDFEKALRYLFYCLRVGNPELTAKIVMLLLEKPDGYTVSEIKEKLGLSYAMTLRLVSELESHGLVDTSKIKVVRGRGRARKLVKISREGLKNLANKCIGLIGTVANI